MSSTAETAAPDLGGGGQPRFRHGWQIVAALAVTQPAGHGVLYYAFSVFLAPMARELRASNAQVAATLTLSVLIAIFSVADKALAPLGAVALAQAVGYGRVMGVVALACTTAALTLVAYHRV
ncbi:hypothetical protein [Streptosporangium sp. NPDC000396]|uniref:hypothetical protein n=1 Tax=Streptosporangium sp. NPDC000396 TaxID=3366185 RepID=UPI00369349D2